jgi:hypothetical protein
MLHYNALCLGNMQTREASSSSRFCINLVRGKVLLLLYAAYDVKLSDFALQTVVREQIGSCKDQPDPVPACPGCIQILTIS